MFGRLIKIANFLDESGQREDADFLDQFVKKLSAASEYEQIYDLFDGLETDEDPGEEEEDLVNSLTLGFKQFMPEEREMLAKKFEI